MIDRNFLDSAIDFLVWWAKQTLSIEPNEEAAIRALDSHCPGILRSRQIVLLLVILMREAGVTIGEKRP